MRLESENVIHVMNDMDNEAKGDEVRLEITENSGVIDMIISGMEARSVKREMLFGNEIKFLADLVGGRIAD